MTCRKGAVAPLRLLLQDHVYNAATNHSVDRETW